MNPAGNGQEKQLQRECVGQYLALVALAKALDSQRVTSRPDKWTGRAPKLDLSPVKAAVMSRIRVLPIGHATDLNRSDAAMLSQENLRAKDVPLCATGKRCFERARASPCFAC